MEKIARDIVACGDGYFVGRSRRTGCRVRISVYEFPTTASATLRLKLLAEYHNRRRLSLDDYYIEAVDSSGRPMPKIPAVPYPKTYIDTYKARYGKLLALSTQQQPPVGVRGKRRGHSAANALKSVKELRRLRSMRQSGRSGMTLRKDFPSDDENDDFDTDDDDDDRENDVDEGENDGTSYNSMDSAHQAKPLTTWRITLSEPAERTTLWHVMCDARERRLVAGEALSAEMAEKIRFRQYESASKENDIDIEQDVQEQQRLQELAWLMDGSMAPSQAVAVVKTVLRKLRPLHAEGQTHGNITPFSVYIRRESRSAHGVPNTKSRSQHRASGIAHEKLKVLLAPFLPYYSKRLTSVSTAFGGPYRAGRTGPSAQSRHQWPHQEPTVAAKRWYCDPASALGMRLFTVDGMMADKGRTSAGDSEKPSFVIIENRSTGAKGPHHAAVTDLDLAGAREEVGVTGRGDLNSQTASNLLETYPMGLTHEPTNDVWSCSAMLLHMLCPDLESFPLAYDHPADRMAALMALLRRGSLASDQRRTKVKATNNSDTTSADRRLDSRNRWVLSRMLDESRVPRAVRDRVLRRVEFWMEDIRVPALHEVLLPSLTAEVVQWLRRNLNFLPNTKRSCDARQALSSGAELFRTPAWALDEAEEGREGDPLAWDIQGGLGEGDMQNGPGDEGEFGRRKGSRQDTATQVNNGLDITYDRIREDDGRAKGKSPVIRHTERSINSLYTGGDENTRTPSRPLGDIAEGNIGSRRERNRRTWHRPQHAVAYPVLREQKQASGVTTADVDTQRPYPQGSYSRPRVPLPPSESWFIPTNDIAARTTSRHEGPAMRRLREKRKQAAIVQLGEKRRENPVPFRDRSPPAFGYYALEQHRQRHRLVQGLVDDSRTTRFNQRMADDQTQDSTLNISSQARLFALGGRRCGEGPSLRQSRRKRLAVEPEKASSMKSESPLRPAPAHGASAPELILAASAASLHYSPTDAIDDDTSDVAKLLNIDCREVSPIRTPPAADREKFNYDDEDFEISPSRPIHSSQVSGLTERIPGLMGSSPLLHHSGSRQALVQEQIHQRQTAIGKGIEGRVPHPRSQAAVPRQQSSSKARGKFTAVFSELDSLSDTFSRLAANDPLRFGVHLSDSENEEEIEKVGSGGADTEVNRTADTVAAETSDGAGLNDTLTSPETKGKETTHSGPMDSHRSPSVDEGQRRLPITVTLSELAWAATVQKRDDKAPTRFRVEVLDADARTVLSTMETELPMKISEDQTRQWKDQDRMGGKGGDTSNTSEVSCHCVLYVARHLLDDATQCASLRVLVIDGTSDNDAGCFFVDLHILASGPSWDAEYEIVARQSLTPLGRVRVRLARESLPTDMHRVAMVQTGTSGGQTVSPTRLRRNITAWRDGLPIVEPTEVDEEVMSLQRLRELIRVRLGP
eukprot:Clim_evm18s201 gene=Clim_evmTU18s201